MKQFWDTFQFGTYEKVSLKTIRHLQLILSLKVGHYHAYLCLHNVVIFNVCMQFNRILFTTWILKELSRPSSSQIVILLYHQFANAMKKFVQTHPLITKAIRFFTLYVFAQHVSTLTWILFRCSFTTLYNFLQLSYNFYNSVC
jgi:hypothetical protein